MPSAVGSRAFQNARLRKQFKKQAEALMPAAIAAFQQGRRPDCQALCRQIIKDLPDHFDALHLLGFTELDERRFEEALDALMRAVRVEPRSAEAHSNLGLAQFGLKRYEEARKSQERAVALQPNFPTALTNLGNVLMRLRCYEKAVDAHDRAIKLKPDYADAYCNRGVAQLFLRDLETAEQSFDRALSLHPRHLQATLGKVLISLSRRHFEAAETAIDEALAINPRAAEVLSSRGNLRREMGRLEEAKADFEAALALDPLLEDAWCGKARAEIISGNIAQAIASTSKALEQNPSSDMAIMLLGACYARQGDGDGAIEHFDRALAINPDCEEAITRKIFWLDFSAGSDFAVHHAARRMWWDRIGAKVPRLRLQRTELDPERRIVVGYVSSDFRSHSAAFAFKPVLRHHDHNKFKIIAYSCSLIRDAVTDECQSAVDEWVDASRFSDDELADRIQADGVDILVDLSGHSAGNRLTVFARKPAPVQVTAWGHATGTGLSTIDYLFSDPVAVPQTARHLFAEKIFDLPCLVTTEIVPDLKPSELPMVRKGCVTFGVFSRTDKISDRAIAIWSKILQEVEGSRIMIKSASLDDAFLRDGLMARFVSGGISSNRLECVGKTSRLEHLAAFADVDISLDPFPQNGGVSTWESLLMGVPVIAKLGASVSSRVGGSIVKACGLDDWVSEDDEGYIAIARHQARRVAELKTLRAELPGKIAGLPAGNSELYTRCVEQGYRKFWRDYCGSSAQAP